MFYSFADYTLDTERYELRRTGVLLRVEPRVFTLLAYLVQQRGHTVTKEELFEQVWPQQFVGEAALTYCVAEARKAIGDSGQAQRYIKTLHGRGYRFIAPVAESAPAVPDLPSQASPELQHPAAELDMRQTDATSALSSASPTPLLPPPPALSAPEAPHAAESGMPDAERRQLTVLACRLVDASGPAASLDPEELLEVVREFQDVCTEIIGRFEGHVAQYQGTGLVMHFGYPRAHEDDARRAVHAGLAIVAGIAELSRRLRRDRSVQLAVRVGIHTGMVVLGMLGRRERREPLALGDTLTIAAQLHELAAPDTVVISPTTLQLVEGYFVWEPLGVQVFDNGSLSLAVYRVLQESMAQSRLDVAITKGLTPFVGREHEVGLLRDRWQQAKDGMGQVVVLSGEAGIGKSRLVQVFKASVAEAAHARVECACLPYYQHTALYPVVTYIQRFLQWRTAETAEERLHRLERMLERYGFELEEMVPLFAALLELPLPARYPPLTLTPQRQKQKTLEAVLAWWCKEAEWQPVCVVVEDLHWADASTLELLGLLMDQVPSTRLLLLLVCRPDFHPPWMPHSHLMQIALSRLSRRQVEAMVVQITGGKSLPSEVLQQLVAKTDGVPLFVEELTKMVLESGLVQERDGRYELAGPLPALAIPATLHDSLMARIDRLGSAKQVAQLGATIGREFAYELIHAVASMDEETLQKELVRLVNAELLYQRGLLPQARYWFKHVLIQDVAYQSLLRSTRQQYHRRIAQVLEQQFPGVSETQPELLAYHYTEAGASAQAVPYWQRAGQRALERSANSEAVSHFTKGLKVLTSLPETPQRVQHELTLQLALGAPLLMLRGLAAPEVEHAYSRAWELCQLVGEIPQRFLALAGLWRFYFNKARFQTARELGEQCFALAQHVQDPALMQEAHMILGSTLYFLGEPVTAQAHLEQGIALYDPQRSHTLAFSRGTDPGVVCLSRAAWVLWWLGYPDQALARSGEAIALAQRLSHPYSLYFAMQYEAFLRVWRREVLRVKERLEAVMTLIQEQGFVQFSGAGMARLGWLLVEQGAVEEGLAQIQKGVEAYRMNGVELGWTDSLAIYAQACEKAGQAEKGLGVLSEALTIAHNNAELYCEPELYRLKGELLRLADVSGREAGAYTPQAAEAEACFQQAIELARRQGAKSLELRAVTSLSRLWQHQGKRAEARHILTETYKWFTEGFTTLDLQEAKALLEVLQ